MFESVTFKSISATEASNHFGGVIEEAAQGKSLFIVTRNGKPQAAILGIDQYRELMEHLETVMDLKDTSLLRKVAEAREDHRLGKTLTLEELDDEFGFPEGESSRESA